MKYIDLFAGIGGFHQAAKAVGWHCVFASEIDTYARLTYHANHGMMPAGDITLIDAQDIPDHDMLMGGFPCQSFSVAGKRKGFEDTRGTLFFEIARILKQKQPRMFLLENVKGLKSHDGGKTFATILDTLKELGYDVHWNILNTKDYGIPQNRERIFILGFKEPRSYIWPEKQPKTTLGEFFGGLWGKDIAHTVRSSGRGSGIDDKHNWDTYIYTDYVLTDKTWHYLRAHKEKHTQKGNGFGYNMVDEHSDHTGTLSARYGKDGSEILVKQIGNPRKLTPQECALLQGFPADFILPVSNTQAYKQLGNAVSVNVVTAILKNI